MEQAGQDLGMHHLIHPPVDPHPLLQRHRHRASDRGSFRRAPNPPPPHPNQAGGKAGTGMEQVGEGLACTRMLPPPPVDFACCWEGFNVEDARGIHHDPPLNNRNPLATDRRGSTVMEHGMEDPAKHRLPLSSCSSAEAGGRQTSPLPKNAHGIDCATKPLPLC